jgi:hypothetical protein
VLKFWFSLVLCFLQVWLQHQIFDSWILCHLLVHPGHHLGSLIFSTLIPTTEE